MKGRSRRFRRLVHQTQDVKRSGAEQGQIHDDKGNERRAHSRRRDWRSGLRGREQAVDRIGLATDLCRDPTRDDRDETGRTEQDGCTVHPTAIVKTPLIAQPQAPKPKTKHEEPNGDHDPEAPEHDRDGRLLINGEGVQPGKGSVHIMLQDQ
jgi:hypothetical protein